MYFYRKEDIFLFYFIMKHIEGVHLKRLNEMIEYFCMHFNHLDISHIDGYHKAAKSYESLLLDRAS